MAKSQQEAEQWEQLENDTAKHHREALDCMIQAEAEAVEFTKASIKAIAMRLPILKPVDFNRNEPVWVITDGSQMGIGAMYGQGKSWDTCRPAGFLSKKFMSAQHNYCTHEHETLAVLEAS